jgi:transposase-like protein
VWEGFSEAERQTLQSWRPSDHEQSVRDIIARRLNEIMYGPLFYKQELFTSVQLRKRTIDLLQRNPSRPNLEYLNRLVLEDMFELAKRQGVPPNGLRRSGMSAYYQIQESKHATITYFSTGGTSWEEAYKTFYTKQQAREHWQMLYSCMDKDYTPEDRVNFLPVGHKLDDFRTPFIIESEAKNQVIAESLKKTALPAPRRSSGNKPRVRHTTEEKAALVDEFQRSELSQKAFAEKHNLCSGVFHRWLDAAGLTRATRSQDEIKELIAEYKVSGLSQQAFADLKGIPHRTLWTYLEQAGMTQEHVRRTPREIAVLVEEFKGSGMTRKEFAREHRMDVMTLRNYLKDCGADDESEAEKHVDEPSDLQPHRRFTDEQVAAILTEYEQTKDITQEEFARAKGIGLKTLGTWLQAAGMTETRKSMEEIKDLVANYRKSGMTQYAFSQSIGIASVTLSRYLKQTAAVTQCRPDTSVEGN